MDFLTVASAGLCHLCHGDQTGKMALRSVFSGRSLDLPAVEMTRHKMQVDKMQDDKMQDDKMQVSALGGQNPPNPSQSC
jgi:hypothetical protein